MEGRERGRPVFSDARLVRGAGDRALLAYTSGQETWAALLDASAKPVWGPKLIPASFVDPRSSPLVAAVPVFGGVAPRVGKDGSILERREISDLPSDINEQASLFRTGNSVFASWKNGGAFMRRLALAEYAAPGLQAVAVGGLTPAP